MSVDRNTPELLEDALVFAIEKHRGARRKGDGRPYILHPFSVVNHLFKIKESESIYLLATAAVLHDVIEDTDTSLVEIAEKFGYTVAQIVEELTSDKEEIKNVGKTEYLSKKMEKMSSWALVIKLIDRLDNLDDCKKMPVDFRYKYCKQTLEIIKHIRNKRKNITKTHQTLLNLLIDKIGEVEFEIVEPLFV